MNNIKKNLTENQFQKIGKIVYQVCGIRLTPGKEELVKARLGRRLRVLNLNDFDEYLDFLDNNKSNELSIMVDALTTNKTFFFREIEHFNFLTKHILPVIAETTRKLRIWSAGCSSGEEPYTLSILLHDKISSIANWDVKILATDISPSMLKTAHNAIYSEELLGEVSMKMKQQYFEVVNGNIKPEYKVISRIKNIIKFAELNLMNSWPMKGPFDVIFCRNVMIYFDKQTRERLINRYWELIKPNGFLFVGHSESLTGISNSFKYVQPAIYRK